VLAGFSWFRIQSSDELLGTQQRTKLSGKFLAMAELLSAAEEGNVSLGVIIY
jgi:hypothetical protein